MTMTIDEIAGEIGAYYAVDLWGVWCVWKALGCPIFPPAQGYRDRYSIDNAIQIRLWEDMIAADNVQIAALDEEDVAENNLRRSYVRQRNAKLLGTARIRTAWMQPSKSHGGSYAGWPDAERSARLGVFITTLGQFNAVWSNAQKRAWYYDNSNWTLPF